MEAASRLSSRFTRYRGSFRRGRHAISKRRDGAREMLTYYDKELGRNRVKRRYVWGAWAFLAGVLLGVVVAHL